MPHEVDGAVHWHEPAGLGAAGLRRFLQPTLAYDRHMAEDGIPVVRAGQMTLLDVAVGPWRRLGAEGAYLQPFGTEGGLGCSLLVVAEVTRAEKHLYEEIVLVLDGRGTTEIWREGEPAGRFEWQPGTLFAIPANALHRMVNAGVEPARMVQASTAAALVNLLGDADCVFANSYASRGGDEGQAYDDVEPDPVQGLALCRTGLVPDAIGCDLPLDNRLSPGYRQLAFAMTGHRLSCVVGEHRPGRYARARLMPVGSAGVCLKGSGVTWTWPKRFGPTPWQDGQADQVRVLEQTRFAMTGAGGDGRWFVQHLVTSATPLRLLTWSVAGPPALPPGTPLEDPLTAAFEAGGETVAYDREDPFVRAEHARMMAGLGQANRMRDDDYAP